MSQLNIENQDIENQRLEIGADTVCFLGPNLTLRNCTLVLKIAARNLLLLQPRLIDCTIEVKRELKNFSWNHAHLKGCRFTGAMTGNDFGRWSFDEDADRGSVENCDFTHARLDACRFVGCDLTRLKLPSWPCFTVLDPVGRKHELRTLQWPGTMRITVESFTDNLPETLAVTYFAPALAKRDETTPEAIRAVLDTLPGVIL
ncbi:pentapeptide repeat-containing protein [Pyxidicoccus parkwayensis]|uniref:Pentapeptide repeat-containing protein n=1 Tax=Pyxidicoccus parkwayensis TaxID=2813578 RepID=A0ABX7NZB4_9BACT|nr:pentapeptide repeat-containing protein [Pyxidicoccus parkwaysis]QSQ22741.1 pentapeptide repeat-containing protein [Pyxidicoccus parkwaysis]